MLLPGVLQLLVAEHVEGARDALAGRMRHDHLVEEAALSGDEGIGETVLIVLDAGLDLLRV